MRTWWLIFTVIIVLLSMSPAGAQDTAGQAVPLPGADALQRAQQALQADDFERAALDASLFILLNPTYSQGYYLRGLAYAQTGDFDRALADLDRAAVLPASDTNFTISLYSVRSIIHAQLGDTEGALADLNAGIAAAPDAAELYLSRADLYAALGELDKAQTDYDRALELDDQLADAYAGRGRLHLRQDDPAAALADYARALALNPDDAEAYARRASIYLAQGETDAALADLDAALRLAPNEAGLYLTRGAALAQANRQPEAAAAYAEWLARTGQIAGSSRLQPGESVVVALAAGRVYRFTFAAQAGQILNVSALAREGTDTDPLIVLLDPAGNPAAADDDGGGAFNALLAGYAVPASGDYTLLVGHAGGSPDGPVRVRLEVVLR